MLYRFGPLNQQGGERRLNVAVTRARSRIGLITSFSSADMDPARLKALGAQMLRDYVKYCESRGTDLGPRTRPSIELNPFERDVLAQLTSAGLVSGVPGRGIGLLDRLRGQAPDRARPVRSGHRGRRRHVPLLGDGTRPRPSAPRPPRAPRLEVPSHLVDRLVPSPRARGRPYRRCLQRGPHRTRRTESASERGASTRHRRRCCFESAATRRRGHCPGPGDPTAVLSTSTRTSSSCGSLSGSTPTVNSAPPRRSSRSPYRPLATRGAAPRGAAKLCG